MNPTHERLRILLCRMETVIRERVLAARDQSSTEALSAISGETEADTIYAIDKVSEAVILDWFARHWPEDLPVQIVMEGLEGQDAPCFPRHRTPQWLCLIDPIDGTRNLMYDKRSAWVLAGVAPMPPSGRPSLREVVAAAMTELPTSRQWASDQLSATAGCGPDGLHLERHDLIRGGTSPLRASPSKATDLKHGFASIAKFFPEGKRALAAIEEQLFDTLYGLGSTASPLVFDDQYITTGGQLYELIVGHDRMIADLRGLVLPAIGYPNALCCHPYDIVTALIPTEAGCLIENPAGGSLDGPMDTTSPISWIGYANSTLAQSIRPVLAHLLNDRLPLP